VALEEHRFVDTLVLARRRHPNAPNSLDALCARYAIGTSARTKHGALIDARILAEVYLELIGGRQASLSLGMLRHTVGTVATIGVARARPRPLLSRLTDEDERAHQAFVAGLGPDPLWLRYRVPEPAIANLG
jgi:DNA polymerase-3 subunit epsilon